jgi:hypothetical protein
MLPLALLQDCILNVLVRKACHGERHAAADQAVQGRSGMQRVQTDKIQGDIEPSLRLEQTRPLPCGHSLTCRSAMESIRLVNGALGAT